MTWTAAVRTPRADDRHCERHAIRRRISRRDAHPARRVDDVGVDLPGTPASVLIRMGGNASSASAKSDGANPCRAGA